jgi:hypothetical protein
MDSDSISGSPKVKTVPDAAVTAVALPPGSPGSPAGSKRSKQQYKEGFLLKQQPNWPYSAQKRFCILQNRQFTYYESDLNLTKPNGALDLRNAQLVTDLERSSRPHSFGIKMASDPHARVEKSRTYVFSALSSEDFDSWVEALKSATSSRHVQEIHWFEKMAQGIF